jgi:ribonuclease Z
LISGNFNITFLGTGAASLDPRSSTSSCLVEIDRRCILVDAGIGVLRQLRKLAISPADISIILITHWHLDHYAGLPALLRSLKNSKLQSILGPPLPMSARLYLTLTNYPFNQIFVPVTKVLARNYGVFSIRSIPTSHTVESYGWAINEELPDNSLEGRKIIISGDTRPVDTIYQASRGIDLLVHEATYLDRETSTANLHQHSTARQAAELAVKAGVGALALTHIPDRYSLPEVLAEAQIVFPRVLVPSPLDTIHIGPVPENKFKEKPGWAALKLCGRNGKL